MFFENAIIFVQGDYRGFYANNLERFFRDFHPKIQHRYLLISHDSCMPVPDKFKRFLDDPKLIAWFGKNMIVNHPKAVCIPLGFSNSGWHYVTNTDDSIVHNGVNGVIKKSMTAYMNMAIGTFPSERKIVWQLLQGKSFIKTAEKKPFPEFLKDLAQSWFVISPRGSGYDTYRTWEALYVGSYPIVKKSPLDVLYKDLPVILVNDWSEVTQEFLQKKYNEFAHKEFKYEKLTMSYWLGMIRSFLP